MLSKPARSAHVREYLTKPEPSDKEITEVMQNGHCCAS